MKADIPLYKEGEIVYHKTEDVPGVIIGLLYQDGNVKYQVTWQGRATDIHYSSELTKERPYFISRSDETEEV